MEEPGRLSADVVVIGGGIIGCAAAAIMADRGARVTLVEATAIAAGASGRNLGAIQHPFDAVLAPLYVESLARYRALADAVEGNFVIGHEPAGLLLVSRDADASARQAERIARDFPELDPTFLGPDAVGAAEPSLVAGLSAVRVATGYPVPPAAATEAWADLAADLGVRFLIGSRGRLDRSDDRVTGVTLEDGTAIAADRVLVAAGPWTPGIVDPGGSWRPIRSTYGVTLQLRLDGSEPTHVVEEDEVDALNRAAAATERAATVEAEAEPPSLFSLASAGGISTLGSTFLEAEPDESRIQTLLLRRAADFLPAIESAEIIGRRMCARPQSVDGRPFIGAVSATAGLFVCAGHGPWGISTGPASAAMAARAVLDGTQPPAEIDASRSF